MHSVLSHFDFLSEGKIIMVIGPVGAGKTQFAAQIWRDSLILQKKSLKALQKVTTPLGARRTDIFFVRSILDSLRFSENPKDSLSYRGGYERLGNSIAYARDSYDIENLIDKNPQKGLWIIDEPAFYDERLASLLASKVQKEKLNFLLTGLIWDFRNQIFNKTIQSLLKVVTDLMPITAYCEHPDCLRESFFTYRFYQVGENEIPAPYFDPLVIVGGDVIKKSYLQPNYSSRCEKHHIVLGKDYLDSYLIPLVSTINKKKTLIREDLVNELMTLKMVNSLNKVDSFFVESLKRETNSQSNIDSLLQLPCLSERALLYLYQQEGLLDLDDLLFIIQKADLNLSYLQLFLSDNEKRFLSI